MDSRWSKFNERHVGIYKKLRGVLVITIYGSYYPESEKEFLIKQRNFLRESGYSRTNLVIDYPNEANRNPLEISIDCLETSDVNFLIFTREGKNQGVTRELTHITTEPDMANKVKFCTVFDETKDARGSMSDLSINDIENSGIGRREFQSEEQLQKALLQQAFAKTRMLKDVLTNRL